MRRFALLLALTATACDALVEDPPAPQARFVTPKAGDVLLNAGALRVEVTLDHCSKLSDVQVTANGSDVRLLEGFRADFDCVREPGCLEIETASIVETGEWSPALLQAKVTCASGEFSAISAALPVTVAPFTTSVSVPGTPVLTYSKPGTLLAQTEDELLSINYQPDGAEIRHRASLRGTAFSVDGQVYHHDPGAGALATIDLSASEPVGATLTVDCAPDAVVAGPQADQVTILSSCEGLTWTVAGRQLENPVTGSASLPLTLVGTPRRRDGQVRLLAIDDGRGLHLVEIAATGQGSEQGYGFTLSEDAAIELGVSGTTFGIHGGRLGADAYDLRLFDAETGSELRESPNHTDQRLFLHAYETTEHGEAIGLLTSGQLTLVGRDFTSSGGWNFGEDAVAAAALPGGMAGALSKLNELMFEPDYRFDGSLPSSWVYADQIVGTEDGWLHLLVSTGAELLVIGIDAPEAE